MIPIAQIEKLIRYAIVSTQDSYRNSADKGVTDTVNSPRRQLLLLFEHQNASLIFFKSRKETPLCSCERESERARERERERERGVISIKNTFRWH